MSDGLVAPLNAPPGITPSYGTQPGGNTQILRARLIIVSGMGEGVFIYNGTPGLGNSPIAWMGSGLVDPFGNVLPSTTGVASSGTFSAGDTIINANGIFIYSGVPGPTTLAYSITNTNVHDPFGTLTGIGFASYAVGFQASLTAGVLNFGTAAGSTQFFADSNGTMAGTTATGYTGTMSLGGVDTTIFTVTQTAFTQISKAWPVPAGDAQTNTAYRLTVGGAGTTGTAQEALSFRLAAFGATLAQFTIGASEFPVSTSFEFTFTCIIACQSATSAKALITGNASVSTNNELTVGGTSNASGGFGQWSGAVPISTGAASTVELQAAWQSAAVGCTVASGLSVFERMGT